MTTKPEVTPKPRSEAPLWIDVGALGDLLPRDPAVRRFGGPLCEKHEYEMGTPAGRARFPEGMTPATEWDLQLMDFALEVAHLFPELAMSPAEIEATIHEAELKNRAGGRDTRYCKLGDVQQTPSLVDRQRVAKGSHENRILLAGLHWDEVRSDRPSAPQSLRSLIGKLCRPLRV